MPCMCGDSECKSCGTAQETLLRPYYEHAGVTLYHADCRDVLLEIVPPNVLITDPPYGVNFTGKVTKHSNKTGQDSYSDTEENFREVVLPAVKDALLLCERAAIFTGTRRLQEYPVAKDIGGIICPNGGGRSSWGFGCYHPVLFYGSSPYIANGDGARPTATVIYHPGMHVTGEDWIEHPCPKPLQFMNWLINVASLPGETVLDIFADSGTTLLAAKNAGRKAIGIEIEERYCEIAAKRLSQEVFSFE